MPVASLGSQTSPQTTVLSYRRIHFSCKRSGGAYVVSASIRNGNLIVSNADDRIENMEYGIKGFPTIKVIVPGKPPVDNQGARDTKPIAEFVLKQALSVGGDSNCSGVVALLEKWMSRFGGTQHIMAGHQMKNIEIPILHSSARVAARLNYLCPQFFPAPGFWSLHKQNGSTIPFTNEDTDSKLCETISTENLLKFHLRPHAQLGLDRSGIPTKAGPVQIMHNLEI